MSNKPWPVALLIGLGGWLTALPMLGFVALLLSPLINVAPLTYLAAALCIGLAVWMLRKPGLGLFGLQLMLPLLMAGFVLLGFALLRDMTHPVSTALLALALLGATAGAPQSSLRAALGAAAAVFLGVSVAWWLAPAGSEAAALRPWLLRVWIASHALLLLVAAGHAAQIRVASGRWAAAIEAPAAGATAALLLALALQAGAAFMLPGVAPELNLLADAQQGAVPWPLSLASCALAFLAAAGWWLAWSQVLGWRGWRGWRRWPMGVAAAVFVLLSWALPTLGATLWVACFASITHRRKRAVLAAVAAGWIISASYYALSWTLQTKALVMAGAGATLLLTALLWLRRERWASAVPGSPPAPETSLAATNAPPPGALGMESAHWRWALPMLCVLCATALAALTVWRYEALLASGRVALFELAPVDPRSLAQGDYMALAWRMPDDMQKALEGRATVDRPLAATRRDSHDVLTLSRLVADSGALGEGEELIELSPKGGRWVLVTDAWFFKEGEAERWAAARYGEFRLMPNGKALLVGLRDEARRKL